MATTSLWHIEGRLKDLIAYVENPEKTRIDNPNLQPLWDVFSYVSRPEATEQGEYVSAVNCLKELALQQMILTKRQYGKENGYIAWHGYQSFKPGEVTPEQAHEIGLQLAKEMWGDRFQIIVTMDNATTLRSCCHCPRRRLYVLLHHQNSCFQNRNNSPPASEKHQPDVFHCYGYRFFCETHFLFSKKKHKAEGRKDGENEWRSTTWKQRWSAEVRDGLRLQLPLI